MNVELLNMWLVFSANILIGLLFLYLKDIKESIKEVKTEIKDHEANLDFHCIACQNRKVL